MLSCSDARGDGEVDEEFWAQAAADQAQAYPEDDNDNFGGQHRVVVFSLFFYLC